MDVMKVAWISHNKEQPSRDNDRVWVQWAGLYFSCGTCLGANARNRGEEEEPGSVGVAGGFLSTCSMGREERGRLAGKGKGKGILRECESEDLRKIQPVAKNGHGSEAGTGLQRV